MSKINLSDLDSLSNEQSAIVLINSNSATIENAADTFLSRTGVSPNQMAADLDMNSNRILNLPSPVATTEPLRKTDLTSFTSGSLVLNQNAELFESRALAVASTIPSITQFVITAGYALKGDGGGALYKRVVSQPSHGGKFQSVDGAWFEIADLIPNLRQFGAVGNFGNDTAAFTGAFQWLNQTSDSGRTLIIPPGNFGKTGTHTINQNGTKLLGYGGRTSVIAQQDDLNCIVMAPAVPATGSNVGFTMEDIGIRRTIGSSANTGTDLTLIGQFKFVLRGVNLFNAVNGINIQGGDNGFIDGLTIDSNQDILVRRVGSTLFKIGSQLNGAAITTHASTICVVNSNISGLGLNSFVDYAVQITGGDGLLFSNCHIGLAGQVTCLLNPSSIAGDYFSSIGFDNCFFDGSAFGPQVFAVQSGNAGQTVTNLKLNNCQIGGGTTNGLNLDYPTVNSVVTGCHIDGNTNFGLILNGGASTTGATIVGNRFSSNGTNYAGDALNNASTYIANNNPDIASVQTTPTVTAATGAFTTVSSTVNKIKQGKLIFFDISIAITTNGTAATGVQIVSFGTTPVREVSVQGKNIISGKSISGRLSPAGALLDIFNYDGTYPGANGAVLKLSGFCEIA